MTALPPMPPMPPPPVDEQVPGQVVRRARLTLRPVDGCCDTCDDVAGFGDLPFTPDLVAITKGCVCEVCEILGQLRWVAVWNGHARRRAAQATRRARGAA